MAAFDFVTCDVFTDRRFGGNPLAVFPAADGLTASQMQTIANEFNLSETVFVLDAEDDTNDARFRIFTPRSEMPFAGHPTVGGAVMAARAGRVSGDHLRIEEPVGLVSVRLDRLGADAVGATLTAARTPTRGGGVGAEAVAPVLGLDAAHVSAGRVWSCGLPFVVVEVSSVEHLGGISVDPQAMTSQLGHLDTADVYAVTATDVGFRARMFAPFDGIPEDPATGSAACAFAGWWSERYQRPDGAHQLVIHQGVEMGRPSELRVGVRLDVGAVAEVTVGGGVVPVQVGRLTL